jgi:NAD(P)-dependent dehydrogenase (short-subunit alcohol dehydrogenase family)
VRRGADVLAVVWCADDDNETQEAQAKLFAAAPTMLEALLSTRDSLQAMADEGIIAEGSWPTIDAAISKATGDA